MVSKLTKNEWLENDVKQNMSEKITNLSENSDFDSIIATLVKAETLAQEYGFRTELKKIGILSQNIKSKRASPFDNFDSKEALSLLNNIQEKTKEVEVHRLEVMKRAKAINERTSDVRVELGLFLGKEIDGYRDLAWNIEKDVLKNRPIFPDNVYEAYKDVLENSQKGLEHLIDFAQTTKKVDVKRKQCIEQMVAHIENRLSEQFAIFIPSIEEKHYDLVDFGDYRSDRILTLKQGMFNLRVLFPINRKFEASYEGNDIFMSYFTDFQPLDNYWNNNLYRLDYVQNLEVAQEIYKAASQLLEAEVKIRRMIKPDDFGAVYLENYLFNRQSL